jgi:hypothetical protein
MNCYCGSSHCLATDGHPKGKEKHPLELQIERMRYEIKEEAERLKHIQEYPQGCRSFSCECCGCSHCNGNDLLETPNWNNE